MGRWMRLYIGVLGVLLFWGCGFAFGVVTGEQVNDSIAQSEKLYADFLKQSFMVRMGWEFNGGVLNQQDKGELLDIAKAASEKLDDVYDRQLEIKQQIEDYQGQDWEDRFGSNGLFRKLLRSVYRTEVNKLEVDLWRGLCCEGHERNLIFKNILKPIEGYGDRPAAELGLIEAKIYSALARVDGAYFDEAKKRLDRLMLRSDMEHRTAVEIGFEYYKLMGIRGGDQDGFDIDKMIKYEGDDDELRLISVILQSRSYAGGLEGAVKRWGKYKGVLGELVLSGLESNSISERISGFEGRLAAWAAWSKGAIEYKKLLDELCGNEKFRSAMVYYAGAVANSKSDVEESARLLTEASLMQKNRHDELLDVDAAEIARQGCLFVYKNLDEAKQNAELVRKVFENYFELANGNIDRQVEYIYCEVLSEIGDRQGSIKRLREIAKDEESPYCYQSRYDLVVEDVKEGISDGVMERIEGFVLDCKGTGEKELQRAAMRIYCGSVLGDDGWRDAGDMISLFEKAEIELDDELCYFESRGYLLEGELAKSVESMLKMEENCSYDGHIVVLFKQIADRLEAIEGVGMVNKGCRKIWERYEGCGDEDNMGWVYLAEIMVFADEANSAELSGILEKINSISDEGAYKLEALRVKARVAMRKGQYRQAKVLWGQICDINKNIQNGSCGINEMWWQGKFYELYCLKHIAEAKERDLEHIIEVLEHSYDEKPQFWWDKISGLR